MKRLTEETQSKIRSIFETYELSTKHSVYTSEDAITAQLDFADNLNKRQPHVYVVQHIPKLEIVKVPVDYV
jgi:hypothetical protein